MEQERVKLRYFDIPGPPGEDHPRNVAYADCFPVIDPLSFTPCAIKAFNTVPWLAPKSTNSKITRNLERGERAF